MIVDKYGEPTIFKQPTRVVHGATVRFPEAYDGSSERAVLEPDESRVFTPMVFGWGYAINLYELGRRLNLIQ